MKTWLVTLALALALGAVGAIAAETATGELNPHMGPMTQKTCPIMKDKVDPSIYVDFHGYRLYTCCKKCQAKATVDQARYMRVLVGMGEKPQLLGAAQTTCPMSGEKVSGKNFSVVDGLRVDFCCGDCEKKFDAMSRTEKLAVVDKLVAGGQAPTFLAKSQTTCPVMGGAINKAAYVDVDGERTYFCCPGCKAKYTADKATYDKKMAAEGVGLEHSPAAMDKQPG